MGARECGSIPSEAQAMLDPPGTYLSAESNAFWGLHVDHEDQRLYGNIRETR